MKEVSILLGTPTQKPGGDIIGVEFGAFYCASHKIPMKIACGDFDSVSSDQKSLIKDFAHEFIELNPIKDETDFEYALSLCKDYDRISVYGGLGRRLDHELVNLFLAYNDPRIVLVDWHNKIQCYTQGTYSFKQGEYQYFSVLPFEASEISLTNFKYPLDHQVLKPFDTYLTSNEIVEEGTLTIHQGKVLVIQSND